LLWEIPGRKKSMVSYLAPEGWVIAVLPLFELSSDSLQIEPIEQLSNSSDFELMRFKEEFWL
jgi:hypothetical protein